ncbi:MAG TPA: type II toxin-antitoxin system prevent-host-death family antitoxin [Solirubrobacteraceae bacterium]|nr:type II toxin-antitoxin system prevent-host-death family antitoxin [Solirubrobacteraceae bacterium]
MTVTEAKAQLSSLVERVRRGEEIVIRRGREPVAKLVAYVPARKRRIPERLTLVTSDARIAAYDVPILW